MSTPNTTERLDLTDFEFDIPCDCGRRHRRTNRRIDCPQPAAWIITSHRHCTDGLHIGLMCEHHHDELQKGNEFLCRRCRELHTPLNLVVRTERIR